MRIRKERLDAIMERQGFESYYDIERKAPRNEEGKPILSARTIYNIANGNNWTRDTVDVLCSILGVSPAEIVEFGNGRGDHTHARPRPARVAKESQVATV